LEIADGFEERIRTPQRMIPGQKMGFRVTEALDRADLIASLKEISPR